MALRISLALFTSMIALTPARADDPVQLREGYAPGYQYHVSTRVDLAGQLQLPPDMNGKNPQLPRTLPVKGNSAIEYDERVLALDAGRDVHKTLRLYRRFDLERQVGSEAMQKSTIRTAVRRLVLLRHQHAEVPFSPDGPLTWGEIDLVRTDVFTPALAGLFPEHAVRPGESWFAREGAILELTDLEKIEAGRLTCRLEQVTKLAGRSVARVAFTGTVSGVNEDGPNRQALEGFCYFDLGSRHLSYLTLKGTHILLDKESKEMGRIEGRFTLTRELRDNRELSDEVTRGLALEPSDDNTQLLYDNPELGVRFQHSRRWKVLYVRGTQLALDDGAGNGVLVSMEAAERVPSAAQFQQEARGWLEQQKASVRRISSPVRTGDRDRTQESFTMEVEQEGKPALLDYHLIRQPLGGATLAVRLAPASAASVRKDIERITRSFTVTATIKPPR
ncbi:MAG: hypothetical protein AB7K24_33775 [Gemmataceae bacterium]